MSTTEKFLTPKEIVSAIREFHGITVSRQFVGSMINAGVKPRYGNNVRLSDLMAWWLVNPHFSPRARPGARSRRKSQRVLRVTSGNI